MTTINGHTRTRIEMNPGEQVQSLSGQSGTAQHSSAQNAVSQHSPSQQGGTADPTANSRETTMPKPLTPAELEQRTTDQLSHNPEYQKLLAKEAALASAELDFAIVDGATVFGRDDGIITIQELKAIIADTLQSDGNKAAAQRLLNNVSLWNELASGVTGKNDNRVGTDDVSRLKEATRVALLEIKNAAREKIREEFAPKAPEAKAPGASPTASNQQGAKGPSVESQVPRPPPSTLPGMDGATENLAIGAEHLQAQMMALAQEASDNPEKAALNAQKIAMLQNKFQALTNMMNQLTQMISNMSKMWSDVAMNSIRNLK